MSSKPSRTPSPDPSDRAGRRRPGPREHNGGRRDPVISRRDLAGWVDGPPRRSAGRWPGERLGLAAEGPTSMAGVGRRVLALFIDWMVASLVSAVWFQGHALVTVGLFALMHVVLIGTLGTTLGKRLAGTQVVRVGGGWTGPVKALIRTVLLCLVVPPLVVDADGRGAHDRWADTVQIRM